MMCAMIWIIVREGCAAPLSLSCPDTPESSGRTVSRRLEVSWVQELPEQC